MEVRADALAEVFSSGEFTDRMKRRHAQLALATGADILKKHTSDCHICAQTSKLP
jgi:hypothetical protein